VDCEIRHENPVRLGRRAGGLVDRRRRRVVVVPYCEPA